MYITNRVSLISALVVWGSLVNSKSIPEGSNSSVLVSEYAKVAHWGSARSSKGQIPWTQRSDASVYYGQNLKDSPKNYDTSEVPPVGEVQERFNLRPYFQYELTPGSGSIVNRVESQKNPVQDSSPPNSDYPVYISTSPSVTALPLPVLPTVQPVPHEDPYTSSYTSYNPPQKQSDTNDDQFDHGSNTPGDHDLFNSQSDQTDTKDSYLPHMDYVENNDKPLFFQSDSPKDSMHHDSFTNNDYMQMINSPPKQGKPAHELHYQAHGEVDHDEVILDHPPAGYENKGPEMAQPPLQHHFRHYSSEEDLPDHHQVYHEIEKPTEEKRVSKPQYSYYYIGRKLWYIPLYFSVYFIIYVTFLILKSIARHKIQFKHDFVDHHHARASRQLTDNERIDNLHNNVSEALLQGKKKFPLVLM
ncbi:hypothetical protein WA026_004660 [Henosepilachna vigintioctopunctata]|uniref:Uncharacterized protein n=1 Tax=Henosepilachna vigintioctopunctata TaxID=420089 RepID=A0AAW1V8L6_9CUCU